MKQKFSLPSLLSKAKTPANKCNKMTFSKYRNKMSSCLDEPIVNTEENIPQQLKLKANQVDCCTLNKESFTTKCTIQMPSQKLNRLQTQLAECVTVQFDWKTLQTMITQNNLVIEINSDITFDQLEKTMRDIK